MASLDEIWNDWSETKTENTENMNTEKKPPQPSIVDYNTLYKSNRVSARRVVHVEKEHNDNLEMLIWTLTSMMEDNRRDMQRLYVAFMATTLLLLLSLSIQLPKVRKIFQ